jgi:hypothetical protein
MGLLVSFVSGFAKGSKRTKSEKMCVTDSLSTLLSCISILPPVRDSNMNPAQLAELSPSFSKKKQLCFGDYQDQIDSNRIDRTKPLSHHPQPRTQQVKREPHLSVHLHLSEEC